MFVTEGEVVLVSYAGEVGLRRGDCAAFKAGVADGHHLQNRTEREAIVLEVGARRPENDEVFYPDIDLKVLEGRAGYVHRNGEPYIGRKPRNPAIGK